MEIAEGTVVSVHYSVRTADGTDVDSSEGRDPLVYLHGSGQIVNGLESALAGKKAGDHVDATVEPAEAYGEYDQGLDLKVPLAAFPEEARAELEPGAQFAAEHPERNEAMLFTVIEVSDETAVITGNHPLAGQTLVFSVDVVEVRSATDEEKQHGHAHGPDGHHHD